MCADLIIGIYPGIGMGAEVGSGRDCAWGCCAAYAGISRKGLRRQAEGPVAGTGVLV